MDRSDYDIVTATGRPLELQNVNDFGFIDFMDEANFQQFMELIRGEAQDPPPSFSPNWDFDNVINLVAAPDDDDLHGFEAASFYQFNSFPEPQEMNIKDDQGGNDDGKEQSPATTPTKPTKKADRSRTLISERKRRGGMKEKLYALRSLVPNITKMDKASIIGDAIRYVQDLQMKTSKLKAEIAGLESSFNQPHQNHQGGSFQDASIMPKIITVPPSIKTILQMEVFQVELREFHVRIVCNKRQGIAALLYNALDSLCLNVLSSNLATASENYLFTFTLDVNEFEMDINLPNLKLWIASAFCNQGFHFVALPSA